MKTSPALFLISPLAHSAFPSAKAKNLCGILSNGGMGFGRVELTTFAAACSKTKPRMDVYCNYTLPYNGGFRRGIWRCDIEESCIDDDNAPRRYPDAGCFEIPSPEGVKGAAKVNGHACSAGLSTGDTVHSTSLALSRQITTSSIMA